MKTENKILKEIEKKLSGLIHTVEADDITGERKNQFTKLNYLAQFEINELMELVHKLSSSL